MKNYFHSFNEREQWMLLIGGLCLILYLYYLFAFAPLNTNIDEKTKQYTESVETLKWMQQVKGQALSKKIKKSLESSQLLTVIAAELKKKSQLQFPYELQQISSRDIQLSFERVPFNFFIAWLERLHRNYSITIKQLQIDPTKIPGITRIVLVLGTT